MSQHSDARLVRAVAEIDETFAFAESVLRRTQIAASSKKALEQQFERLAARRADPQLYVAVVGEFSSGKSTFINALLREPLLTTSALVATTTPTELRHAEAEDIEVDFGDGSTLSLARDQSTLDERLEAGAGWRTADLSRAEVLRRLTSDDHAAAAVDRVRVLRTAPLLAENVVVIDTPGLNSHKGAHAEATRRVVAEEADLCVVTIPSSAPLSMTLRSFLTEQLEAYLHRCVFVVTKMKWIDEAERAELLSFVEQRIVDELGIAQPTVLPCSVGAVMTVLDAAKPPQLEDRMWLDRFVALEQRLSELVRAERAATTCETLARLLEALLRQLELGLRRRGEALRRRQDALQRGALRDLESFVADQQRDCHDSIDEAKARATREIDEAIAEQHHKAIKALRRKLNAATTAAELDAVMTTHADKVLRRHFAALESSARSSCTTLAAAATAAAKTFDERFAAEYSRLKDVGLIDEAPPAPGRARSSRSGGAVADELSLTVKSVQDEEGGRTLGGAATGAIIGSIFLTPGLGTIIGGAVGGFVGSMFGPTVDERRARYVTKLVPAADKQFAAAGKAAHAAVRHEEEKARAFVDKRLDAYLTQYKHVVEEAIAHSRREEADLARLRARTDEDLRELERRRSTLAEHRHALASLRPGSARIEARLSA